MYWGTGARPCIQPKKGWNGRIKGRLEHSGARSRYIPLISVRRRRKKVVNRKGML